MDDPARIPFRAAIPASSRLAGGAVMVGIFISSTDSLGDVIEAMDKTIRDWTMRAARGECAWVCVDCCCTFQDGMPDECAHGHQGCTDIIQRDKADAMMPDRGCEDV